MSISQQLKDKYTQVLKEMIKPKIKDWRPDTGYPAISYDSNDPSVEYFPNIIEQCTSLYNVIDSAIQTLKITIPEVYNDMQNLIENKILGGLTEEHQIYDFYKATGTANGGIKRADTDFLPLGIKSVLELLTKATECRINGYRVNSDEYYYTAWVSYRSLESALKQFLIRLDYVIMYPHRIILDRMILETILRKNGLDSVITYLQSAEQYFNEKKYVEFCAISRNALQETIKNICLLLFGDEHGYPENLKRLEEIGFIRGTIVKQAKEFGGSLSAYGSHPPTDKLSPDEAKFLLDSLYSFLGLFALQLVTFKNKSDKKDQS